MTNPIIREHNQETGEIVDREMTDQEFQDFEAVKAAKAAKDAEEAAKLAAKESVLAKLGLTSEEVAALLA